MTLFDRDLIALLAVTFLSPIVLAAAFFPTPSMDLREHINLGANFLLVFWKAPPLQSWMAGLVALSSIRDSWIYIAAAQVFNLVALIYLVKIARDFMSTASVVPIVIAFCGSVFPSFAVLSMALDADQLLPPLWLGMLYHVLRGMRDDRLFDWLAAGVFAAFAILTKYTSVLFFLSLALALLVTNDYRAIVRRPGPYLAALLAVALSSVHLIPVIIRPDAVYYGTTRFVPTLGIEGWNARISGLTYFSATLLGIVLLVGLPSLKGRSALHRIPEPLEGARRVITITALFVFGFFLLLIGVAGARYRLRYGSPLVPLALIAAFCLVHVTPQVLRFSARALLAMLCAATAGSAAFALEAGHFLLQEPAPAAAAIMRAQWDRSFTCGPSYVLGETHTAHGIGLYFGRTVIGVGINSYESEGLVDRLRLRALGAIIVKQAENVPTPPELRKLEDEFPPPAEPAILQLPLRRNLVEQKRTYIYWFVPPTRC